MKYYSLSVIAGIQLLFLFICNHLYAQPRVTGLLFDEKRYNAINKLSPALRFAQPNAPKVSLRRYCPTPLDQGSIGSCVAWTVGYAALTISFAITENNTSTSDLTANAKSALYIFNQIHNRSASCETGSFFEDALNLVKAQGDCNFSTFNPSDCRVLPTAEMKNAALSDHIAEYYGVFNVSSNQDEKIIKTINCISANKPVLIGINLTNSIFNLPSTGLWNPASNEPYLLNNDGSRSGHALCVIGYDNTTRQFEIMNSWGSNYGDHGFFYMSYDNFAKFAKYGYQVTINPRRTNTNVTENVLSGNFYFKKFLDYDNSSGKARFEDVPASYANGAYSFSSGQVKKDSYYKIVASGMQKNSYVYIFSLKPDNTTEILFPISLSSDGASIKDLPIIPSPTVSINIPADDGKAISTDQAGDDNLCILYSSEKIADIKSIVARVKSLSGDFTSRVQTALGNRAVKPQSISYKSNYMGFTARTTTGGIVPLILKNNVID